MAASNEQNTPLVPHLNSRPKRQPAGDEEATSQLKLGELQDAHTLNLSEARLIMTIVLSKRAKGQLKESDVMSKTTQYLEDFARFRSGEHTKAVARLLDSRPELAPFEKSQLGKMRAIDHPEMHHLTFYLGNLCPEEAEKAKALIPSLEDKISDDDLQDLLGEIQDSETAVV